MHRKTSQTRKWKPARPILSPGLAFVCAAMILAIPNVKAQTADSPAPAQAQEAPAQAQAAPAAPAPAVAPRKKSKNPSGTPLDTLMSTRLWADVPEAKDFVRQARPQPDSLDFKPTAGTDPERPKVRTKSELDALQSELESAAQRNQARGGLRPAVKPPLALAGAQNGKKGEPKKALPN
jgi:hypothetical protein